MKELGVDYITKLSEEAFHMEGVCSENAAGQKHETFIINKAAWFLKHRKHLVDFIFDPGEGILIERHQTCHDSVEINELSSKSLVLRIIDLMSEVECLQFRTFARFSLVFQTHWISQWSSSLRSFYQRRQSLHEDGSHSIDGHSPHITFEHRTTKIRRNKATPWVRWAERITSL